MMQARRPFSGLSTSASLPSDARAAGGIEALLLVMLIAGKIAFWLPLPVLGIRLSPLATVLLILAFFTLSFRPTNLLQALRVSMPFFIGAA
ncbi:MAG: hypothetical protein ACOC3D_13335, partial [Pseudomonadota bacterium]